ncbi:MAG: hypothetical protein KC544_00840 [Gemmatimonadetes bacterium]|nr:hypothetical protein [Gemmatimonadota bacterium]MCB9505422.1 hypothetical protein [Gemmatimonadales bacterium]MCA9761655.1 hypothetical protein [Gemmatimonadota bacterium]MCA9767309.1 hypothetical protein [Gemmatimonadota bacterium]MCB9518696.1 hypothetical protein [Gemmatimonadales bacterium]
MQPKTLGWLAVLLAFVAFLTWSTLSAQKVECEVCVEFNGRRNCAIASHETELEAARSAQNTACGPLTSGMNDAIACDARPPLSKNCTGG